MASSTSSSLSSIPFLPFTTIKPLIVKKNKKAIEIIPPVGFSQQAFVDDNGNAWFFEKFKVQKKTGQYVAQYRKQAYLDTAFKPVECVYCGVFTTMKNITRDHVKPRARGHVLDESNLILCCKSCNGRKECRDLGEWIWDEFVTDYLFYLHIRPRIQAYLDSHPRIDSSDWNKSIKQIDTFRT